jgi:RHS repeat-associated protein
VKLISRVAREAQTGTALDSDVDKTTTQISYMDGLGKSLQAQIWKGGPDKTKDIISSTTVYNAYAVAYKGILPTPSDGATGAYKSNAESLASSFYGDANPFMETVFEQSPLNRPIKQFGAGQAWRIAGNEKFVAMAYQLQGGGIGRFDLQTDGSVQWTNSYPPSSLFSLATTSERGFVTYELKDKLGRVTHKFQQLQAGFTFAISAYIYDDLTGNLAFVIPPEAYNKFGTGTGQITSFTENDLIFKELCFGYLYDSQNRQIGKHIPGAGWVRYVFDKNQNLVLENDDKDAASTPNYYKFTKFDALNRPIYSGLINNIGTISRSQLQTDFDNFTGQSYETISSSGLFGYTNVSFPSSYTPVEANGRLIMFYDDYAWQTNSSYNFQASNAFHAQGLAKGVVTGTIIRNLETNDWYRHVNYVDYKGRIIQQFSQNHLGGIDRIDYQYRFNGEVLKMRITHKRAGFADVVELYEYSYNHTGLKTSFTHNSKVVSKYEYDGIGRLSGKKFSPAGTVLASSQTGNWNNANTWQSGVLPLANDNVTINTGQTITIPNGEIASAGTLNDKGILKNFGTLNMGKYSTADLYNQTFLYHIRGGLRGLNLDASGNLTNSLFSMKLSHEDANFYDGNIGKQEWKSNLDNVTRSFTYNYDGENRILSGIYGSTKAGENYSLNNVSYDLSGNITALSRNGWKANNTFDIVDNLAYTYNPNSNKILKVDDLSNETASFRDIAGNDYGYSLDGSLTSDANKGITLIEYNYLKLPRKVVQNGVITLYQYDATGKKLKETIVTQVTDYVGNKIYKNNILYQISHNEGRIVNGIYEYDIKDHLGSLRVAFKDSLGIAKIVQTSHTGIFGEELTTLSYRNTPNLDNHKYTGKENLQGTGYTDFGARWYDNLVPRFVSIDPLAEKWHSYSTYSYTINNPVRFIDPDGRDIINYKDRVTFTGGDAQILFRSLVSQSNSSEGIKGIHFVYESLTKNIYKHTLDAFRQGKPEILHYDADKKRQELRRAISLKGIPTKKDNQRDEYPYASTTEGGSGALVTYVPSRENSIQGGMLGGLYKKINDGDPFLVLPIPDESEQEPQKLPVLSPMMKKISEATGLTGAALIMYVIFSEGSRLFPPRNLIPIP